MKIQSLQTFSKLLIIVGIILTLGAVITTIMGKGNNSDLGLFATIFCVVGVGFLITDGNISKLSQIIAKDSNKDNEENGNKDG